MRHTVSISHLPVSLELNAIVWILACAYPSDVSEGASGRPPERRGFTRAENGTGHHPSISLLDPFLLRQFYNGLRQLRILFLISGTYGFPCPIKCRVGSGGGAERGYRD